MLDQIKKLVDEYGWEWCRDSLDWIKIIKTLEETNERVSRLYLELQDKLDRQDRHGRYYENRVELLENKIDSLNEELYVLKRENKALKDREVLLNSTNHSSHHENEYHVKVKVGFDDDPDFYTVANSQAYLKHWRSCLQRDSYICDNDGSKITISVGDDN